MSTVAIIPARGGSKGIPRKNLLRLHGRSLIWYSIQAALSAKAIDRVLVSTEDAEIGEEAEQCGAEWIHRSDHLATDSASTESVVAEVLQVVDAPRLVCLLQPTSPIRQPGDIDICVNAIDTGSDSIFSARHVEGYTWSYNTSGQLDPHYGFRSPRQFHRTRQIEENGSIYVFKVEKFWEQLNRLCGRIDWVWQHPLDSFQLDDKSDIELIESLIPLRMPWLFTATSTECCATRSAATDTVTLTQSAKKSPD